MNNLKDTILAQSTPIGYGGIGIIRISGNKVKKILKKMFGKITKNRYATYLPIKNKKNKIIDYGIIIYFKKPNSYTGEDILEIHSHGGQKIIELIINSIVNLNIKNIRIAYPGEFTERAFINKKIDLIQAESINEIIYAKSENLIFSAIESIKGKLSNKIKNIINIIKINIINIENEINFSESEINKNYINIIKKNIINIYKKIKKLYLNIKQNLSNINIIKIIIIGKPNVGKSSLMNLITSKNTSIVTNIKGTTRDIIKENININNKDIEILDTTGIHKTNNKIEKIGIKKTWKEINKSNIIIFIDNSYDISEKNIINKYKNKILKKIKKNNKIHILLRNKIDITKEKFYITKKKNYLIINISIKKKIGIKELIKIIKKKTKNINIQNNFLTKKRHINLIKLCIKEFKKIINLIKQYNFNKKVNLDLLYEYLLNSQKYLCEIIGKNIIISDEIIKNIFSNFCIGK